MIEEKPSSENDLLHFLRLAKAQVRHRIDSKNFNGAANGEARLHLLEELIKEQIPNEDRRSAVSKTR